MNRFDYPTKSELKEFVKIITNKKYRIAKYLPKISDKWYDLVSDCINYVSSTAHYESNDFHFSCARLLYKIAKRHELGDGNKRSAVIAVYLFAILNDYYVIVPNVLKQQARRAAKSKGRRSEEFIKKRIAEILRINITN